MAKKPANLPIYAKNRAEMGSEPIRKSGHGQGGHGGGSKGIDALHKAGKPGMHGEMKTGPGPRRR
jgi:hypothetical protein